MAVIQTWAFRVRAGKTQEFMGQVATGKKIRERLGARVRVLNVVVGTYAPCTVYTSESADWKAYGELSEKLATDSEYQKFLAKAFLDNRDPSADLIATGLSVDVPVG